MEPEAPISANEETKTQYETAAAIVSQVDTAMNKVMDAMSINALVKFREAVQTGHAKQIALINKKLREKGYVEPHLVGALKHTRE